MDILDGFFAVLIGLFLFSLIGNIVRIAKRNGGFGYMSEEEANFAKDAAKLADKGLNAKRSKTAEEALMHYEILHDELSSHRNLVSEHIYQDDLRDMREAYEVLSVEEWQEKARRILDKFARLYVMITGPNFKDVEKAYRSKKRCIEYWQEYYYSIPYETGIWYDAKNYLKEYLADVYDPCMESHEALEKKLARCIEEMKPEYKRKLKLREQILNVVAVHESIMRSKLIAMPFEGCTAKEVEYCVRELVDKYQLVALKIGNRYFISLSDKEKAKRIRRKGEIEK